MISALIVKACSRRRRLVVYSVSALIAAVLTYQAFSADDFSGPVSWVYDGDTIEVEDQGQPVRVRIFGIDCPEKGQPYADQARNQTIRLAKGRKVIVQVRDIDQYQRVVGIVLLPGGRDLGRELLRSGLAWPYDYGPQDREMDRLAEEARAAGRGLWRDPRAVPPHVFRRMKK
ncbi:MAG: thermonuclease family protein [Thermodesulfobacteriota bacterium]